MKILQNFVAFSEYMNFKFVLGRCDGISVQDVRKKWPNVRNSFSYKATFVESDLFSVFVHAFSSGKKVLHHISIMY